MEESNFLFFKACWISGYLRIFLIRKPQRKVPTRRKDVVYVVFVKHRKNNFDKNLNHRYTEDVLGYNF